MDEDDGYHLWMGPTVNIRLRILGWLYVALGGVGSVVHIKEAIAAGASAVAAGAFFVFQGPHRAVLITYPRPEDVASLLSAQ